MITLCVKCKKEPRGKYYTRCRECRRICQREYYLANAKRYKNANRKRYYDNPEPYKEYQRNIRKKYKDIVVKHYGSKCVCCGEAEDKFLTFDHIAGGGNKHRKKIGKTIHRWLIKNDYPSNFQILCFNCNFAKGSYGRCPHEVAKK